MAGIEGHNRLILGSSGSGKSEYLKRVILAYQDRAEFRVMLNTSREMRELFAHSEVLTMEDEGKTYAPEKLAALIRHHGSVHFECAAGPQIAGFVEALCQALFLLGEYDADRLICVLFGDEIQRFFPKGGSGIQPMPPAAVRLETEGRKYGLGVVKATQNLTNPDGLGLSIHALKQLTSVTVFCLVELNQQERVMRLFPAIPNPGQLRRPDRAKGHPPECVVLDVQLGRVLRVNVDPATGARTASWLIGEPTT